MHVSEIDGIAGEMSLVISEGASSASAEKGGKVNVLSQPYYMDTKHRVPRDINYFQMPPHFITTSSFFKMTF